MATVPTTNIKFSDIYQVSNPGGTTTPQSLNTMSYFSYFSGPNGSNTVSDNNWGQGEISGADRIYRTNVKTTNIKVSDFSDLDYYYNGNIGTNTYPLDIAAFFSNNCPPPNIPPDPPDVYDFNYTLTLYDHTYTYTYISYGSLMNQGTNNYNDLIRSPDTVPLINTYYWQVDIQTTPGYPGTGGNRTVEIKINGTNYVTGATITNGTNTFLGSTYGTAVVDKITSTIDPFSTYTPYTGSYWSVKVS
jgi:hypothetical protein